MRHCRNREFDGSPGRARADQADVRRAGASRPGRRRLRLFPHGEGRTGEGGYWCGFADAKFRHVNEHLPVFDGGYCRDELSKSSFSLALGHRRLAIIDLTHMGHQPMSSSDRRHWITFNGEIYNFPELRRDLQAAGHVFRTRSDTEVILHLWEEHGPDCLPMLDGMFAFAIYDRVENVLTLVARSLRGEAAVLCRRGRFPRLRQRDQGAFSPRACCRRGSVRRRWSSTSPFKTRFRRRRSFAASRSCSRANSAAFAGFGRRRGAAPLSRRLSALRPRRWPTRGGRPTQVADALLRQAVARQLVSDVEVGSLPLRRHGQRLDRRRGGPLDPAAADLHRRLRPDQRQRHRAGLRRAEAGGKALLHPANGALRRRPPRRRHARRYGKNRLAHGRPARGHVPSELVRRRSLPAAS